VIPQKALPALFNADCFLTNPGRAIGNILKAAEGSITLLERLEIDRKTMRATGSYYLGLDAFGLNIS
jgi:hypothetical protein